MNFLAIASAVPLLVLSQSDLSPASTANPLRLQIDGQANQKARLEFPSESGFLYRVESSSGIPSQWVPFTQQFPGQGAVTQIEVPIAKNSSFYRVVKDVARQRQQFLRSAPSFEKISTYDSFAAIPTTFSPVTFDYLAVPRNRPEFFLADGNVDDDGGPDAWVQKVKWLLQTLPLICDPGFGSSSSK